MDGLDSRAEVVVIGATNRLDSIDPALRRPGRFDREFRFTLPDRSARRTILDIHTRAWQPAPPSPASLDRLADKCIGCCGADLRAICAEAALIALRRTYPQIYDARHKLVLDVSAIDVSDADFDAACAAVQPAARRGVTVPVRPLSDRLRPLLTDALDHIIAGHLPELFRVGILQT
jgi:SpoVK/Ycf46/Vps4 family AAA+-type ATPase